MDYELGIVGSGFWGTACKLKAKERGIEAVVLDNRAPWAASRNAAGMIHPDWFKGDTIGKLIPPSWSGKEIGESITWLMRYGLVATGELFKGPKGERRRTDAFMMTSIPAFLALAESKRAEVSHFRRLKSGGWRVFADCESISVDVKHLIVAAGTGTDTLLSASSIPTVGVTGLRGRGVIIRPKHINVASLPYRVQTRPYVSYTLRPWEDGLLRFGDTTEPTDKGAAPMKEMLAVLDTLVSSYERVETHDGKRPVCARFTVHPAAPGLVVATGGHRVGLGVAGVAAEKALQLIKARFV